MGSVALADLEAQLEQIRSAPSERGSVVLIVCRPAIEQREVVGEARVDEREGLIGDGWRERGAKSTPDGSADSRAQITLTSSRSMSAIAGAREQWPIAGDQLYVDFDLSEQNLPPGTLLEVGSAILEVSDLPHRGCGKFSARFGVDALKFVNSREGRALNLRGINARVVRSGVVHTGETVIKRA
jgi:MOSC domain-containing protein YiiM